jgi:LPPG:FO 2-phospho-L-lactate transferase
VNVVVLAGGFGGARFLQGVRRALHSPGERSRHAVAAIVNTGDDLWLHGLRICPDLDTCMYTLGGGIDRERGWGRAGETWSVREELAAYGVQPSWFGLGDRDVATHLVRTRMLRAGFPLSAVTEALCTRWQPGVTLLPMTDEEMETHVVVADAASGGDASDGYASDGSTAEPAGDSAREVGAGLRAIHFQQWWLAHRAQLPAQRFVQVGADGAKPAPGVLGAIAAADAVLLAPSNPVVSIGAILAVPGIADALRAGPARVVGLSPIVAGRPLRGMAAECLAAVGVASTAEAVARHYGARRDGGLLDGWLVHTGDVASVPGVRVRAVPLLMTDEDATAEMAREALELAGVGIAAA